MRIISLAVIAAALAFSSASAQQKKQPTKGSSGPVVRYVELSSGIVGDLNSEGWLRETRNGTTVTEAQLDVCFSVSPTSNRKDRFVVTLTPANGKLTGAGQTQEDKLPVAIEVTRNLDDQTVALSGDIKLGTASMKIETEGNDDISEAAFKQNQPEEEAIVAEPADFSELSPGSISLRVKRDALADVVKVLRVEKASVSYDGLLANCAELRSGRQFMKLDVNPESSGALLAKLAATPGVIEAGWGSGYSIDNAVKLAASAWQDGSGKLDRKKIADGITASLATALSATLQSAEWNEANGELTLKFKRPSQTFKAFGFTEIIGVTILPGPEKPKANDALVLWFGDTTIEIVDEGPEPRLKLLVPATGEEDSESPTTIDVAALSATLGHNLKGQIWSAEASAWK